MATFHRQKVSRRRPPLPFPQGPGGVRVGAPAHPPWTRAPMLGPLQPLPSPALLGGEAQCARNAAMPPRRGLRQPGLLRELLREGS